MVGAATTEITVNLEEGIEAADDLEHHFHIRVGARRACDVDADDDPVYHWSEPMQIVESVTMLDATGVVALRKDSEQHKLDVTGTRGTWFGRDAQRVQWCLEAP